MYLYINLFWFYVKQTIALHPTPAFHLQLQNHADKRIYVGLGKFI